MRCMKCGNIINDGVQFCPECGSKVERSCRSCGAVLSDNDKFCPSCGQKRSEQNQTTGDPYRADREEAPVSLTDRIINGVLSLQDTTGITDDTYRNELVKKVFVYNVAGITVTLSILYLSFRVYEESGLSEAVVAFFLIAMLVGAVDWLFKFGKCEENLKKYDTVLKEAGKQSAILVVENNSGGGRTGCLVTCMLILIVLVLMSFC
ncbi:MULTISPECIES: zinc-ribbon domain-containing protein [Enterocloster]|uniref:Double zinc ribbon n=1 Tax=Enterocloster lavalensis TaxID=460384 RepID=A0A1I0K242_9FIRM|nr:MULTISPECIES: zinc-ribbon domain-containing protein [Enterocloster]MDR3756643.1 zinc-ribbon domain-containing protein [Enterocloster sp.]SEU17590.1 Double zinc ribbon [Enterocloster lavalensis]